jgi:signal transduction histidine kinase
MRLHVKRLTGGHARPRSRRSGVSAFLNLRVILRLIALIAIPTAMGLTFGAIRVATADSASNQFGQIETLARLGQQVTGLAGSLEDERDLATGYVAAGQPATVHGQLVRQYAVTDAWVTRVRASLAGLGTGYPAQAQARIQGIQTMLNTLPGARGTKNLTAIGMVNTYTGMVGDLLSYTDDIAPGSADPTLVDTARTLGWLSRMEDAISQERAILYSGLIERRFETGATTQLDAQQAQKAIATSQFESSAAVAQQQLLAQVTNTNGDLSQDDTKVMLALAGTSPAQLGVTASQWYASTSGALGQLRGVEQQVAASVVARAQRLHQGATDSARLSVVLSFILLAAALAATFAVAGSIVRPLRRLRGDALQIASVRLPEKMLAIAAAEDPSAEADVAPVSVASTDEIGEVARAFDQVHREAVKLAANEAVLRRSMNGIFVNLSRRSQSLLLRLVRQIDSLEQSEDDPDRLASLFTMDHLVTRMRRHSENLLVFAGYESARKQAEPLALPDLVRAAVSEISEFGRVEVNIQPDLAVAGQSVSDIVHLLAEILENATTYSPAHTRVQVTGEALPSGGVVINVADRGVGLPADRLAELNDRLENPPVADVSVARHMGLFVVAHLAERHGVRVRLRQGERRGLAALVWIPERLIMRQRPDRWPPAAGRERQPRVAETAGTDWFGKSTPAQPAHDSPVNAGWQAAPTGTGTAAAPAYDGLTTAGLPQRTPHSNVFQAAAGEPPASGGAADRPRSADRARAQLGAFQRGSLRVERDQSG